jgi:hypothetical protein
MPVHIQHKLPSSAAKETPLHTHLQMSCPRCSLSFFNRLDALLRCPICGYRLEGHGVREFFYDHELLVIDHIRDVKISIIQKNTPDGTFLLIQVSDGSYYGKHEIRVEESLLKAIIRLLQHEIDKDSTIRLDIMKCLMRNNISETFTPVYSIVNFGKKTYLKTIALWYEHQEWKNTTYYTHYRLYKAKHGASNPPIFILAKPNDLVNDSYLRLEPLVKGDIYDTKNHVKYPAPLDNILRNIQRAYNIKIQKGVTARDKRWRIILDTHLRQRSRPFMFKSAEPLSVRDKSVIATWDFDKIVEDYFYEGMEKDDRVIYAYRGQLVTFSKHPLQDEDTCEHRQPYNSHCIIVTPTKRGKSWIADKMGKLFSKASSSRLTGFSTANDVNEGEVNGTYVPIGLDNVHNFSPETLRGILELLESGRTLTGKGKQAVLTRTLSAFIFHANPPNVDSPIILAQAFLQIIQQLASIGVGAVGSRFALILFGLDYRKASGHHYSTDSMKKNKIVLDYIMSEVNPKVENIIYPDVQVQEWLTTPLYEYYELITRLFTDFATNSDLKEFWMDNSESAYRHIRGLALKQAVMDNLKLIFLGIIDIPKILEDAEIHVKIICNHNTASLRQLINLSAQQLIDFVYSKYEGISSARSQAIVLAVAAFVKKDPSLITVSRSLSLVSSVYNALPDDVKPKGYPYFSNVHSDS